MLSLVVQGSSEVDSTLILSCIIPTFTGSATWSRENIIESTCFHDLCFPYMQQHYTFSSNNSDIFVAIYPLTMTENGTTWTCYHGDDSTSYTVLVQSSITTNQPPTESTFVPPPGELSIVGKGSFEAGSALLLSCIIPTFTGFALWYRDNVLYAYCTPDTCDTDKPMVNSNTSGIFVLIDPLTMTENGTEWGCSHNFYNTFYTVFVQPSITTNQPPTDSCQEPYQKIGNGCYSIHDDNISGDEAFASCTDPGAYLANFETLEEAMFMKVFLQRNKTGISYFVGGRNVNRYLSSGDWRWIKHGNATKMTYFAFAPGQPSWSAEKGEDCMFFYANDRYNFYNVMCDNGHFLGGFICEI
ncbi:uncharacterized protein [Mytilus edulis]|uniref:uncharacterized protein n=1 Tax=Mytilus edulis TaxID=6550 RepID=UPI0039F0AE00